MNVSLVAFKGDFSMNLALSRPANQSSTWPAYMYEASNAVDGDVDTFSATNDYDFQPWWKVQLAYPVWVSQVEITSYTGE